MCNCNIYNYFVISIKVSNETKVKVNTGSLIVADTVFLQMLAVIESKSHSHHSSVKHKEEEGI